jgi:hypothetical protein
MDRCWGGGILVTSCDLISNGYDGMRKRFPPHNSGIVRVQPRACKVHFDT